MKKRILYIGNKLSNSGSTVTSIETLGFFLQKEGYTVVTASSIKNKLFRLLDMFWQTFRNRKNASVVLIDTYSTQNFYYAVGVAKICRVYDIPYIPILRGGNLPARLDKSPGLCKKLFQNAKTNVVPSKYLMEAFQKKNFDNLTYIPNTISIKNYLYKKREINSVKLLWVRSFSEIYNPTLAITIIEKLLEKKVDVHLCMIGPEKDGSLALCKDLAKQKQLPIEFTGLLSKTEWIKYSENFNLFINTTNFDNTPVSVIEAMALGLPVISTDVGGVPYLISNNETGILVPKNNSEAFVEAILNLINEPDKVLKISEEARKQVESYDWEQVKLIWQKVLD